MNVAHTPEFKRELVATCRRMFPEAPEDLKKARRQLSCLRQCRSGSLLTFCHDQIYVWHPKTPTIYCYAPKSQRWSQMAVDFPVSAQWWTQSLNAVWTLSDTKRVAIFAGAKLSEVDLTTGALTHALVAMDYGALDTETRADFAFEKGQLQWSPYHRCWIFALLQLSQVLFFTLHIEEGRGRLEPVPTPPLPLANFEDFPTRLLLKEGGRVLCLYNARPPQNRPARNELFEIRVDGAGPAEWAHGSVTDELAGGDWRRRCHPRVSSLWVGEGGAELLCLDYEWHFSFPDSGYGVFRLCRLCPDGVPNTFRWEILREVSSTNEELVSGLGLPSGAHISRFDRMCPDVGDGALFFLSVGVPGTPVTVVELEAQPKPLQSVCVETLKAAFPAIRRFDRDQLHAIRIGHKAIEQYF